jgi:putative endonuclease
VIYAPESGEFFYGYFEDLDKVLEMHNSNLIPPTKGKGPWVMLFSENFENRIRAIRQVSFYRSVKGQRFLKNVLNF